MRNVTSLFAVQTRIVCAYDCTLQTIETDWTNLQNLAQIRSGLIDAAITQQQHLDQLRLEFAKKASVRDDKLLRAIASALRYSLWNVPSCLIASGFVSTFYNGFLPRMI